jgi:myo-inositol-1(or 4)-monophosphatase
MNIETFLEKIRECVTENVSAVMALRNERKQKDDSSFVTQGDLLINDIILEIALQQTEQIIIVSEENVNAELEDEGAYILVVDPIDGTENFTSGLPEWGVSVSCFHHGRHVGSLLGCPEMNIWLKSGDAVPNFFSRIRGLSSSLQKEDLVVATKGHEYRILGCCVYNMINVIRGSFLSFENPKGAHSWDILAGINLALEHNLKVIVNGKEYSGEYLPAHQKYRFWVGR